MGFLLLVIGMCWNILSRVDDDRGEGKIHEYSFIDIISFTKSNSMFQRDGVPRCTKLASC